MQFILDILIIIFSIHAVIDCLCTILTLFPVFLGFIPEPVASFLLNLYRSPFPLIDLNRDDTRHHNLLEVSVSEVEIETNLTTNDSNNSANTNKRLVYIENVKIELINRFLIYWIAAMSLVRVMVVLMPGVQTLSTVALMYVLEGLAVEYEGFTTRTMDQKTARMVSFFSFTVSSFCFVLVCSKSSYQHYF